MRADENESSTVIGRSLAIIDVVASARRPLSLSEIARCARLPKTTTLRLLGKLVEHRVVTRGPVGYGLGPRLHSALDSSQTSRRRLRRLLMPYLLELHRVTGMPVSLGVLNHHEVHFVETLFTHSQLAGIQATGERLPAHLAATGKAILAYHPEALTSLSDLDEYDQLVAEIVLIRRSGLAYPSRSLAFDLQGVAAPVFARSGIAVAAISIGGLASPDPIAEAALTALRRVAHEASAALRRGQLRRPAHARSAPARSSPARTSDSSGG